MDDFIDWELVGSFETPVPPSWRKITENKMKIIFLRKVAHKRTYRRVYFMFGCEMWNILFNELQTEREREQAGEKRQHQAPATIFCECNHNNKCRELFSFWFEFSMGFSSGSCQYRRSTWQSSRPVYSRECEVSGWRPPKVNTIAIYFQSKHNIRCVCIPNIIRIETLPTAIVPCGANCSVAHCGFPLISILFIIICKKKKSKRKILTVGKFDSAPFLAILFDDSCNSRIHGIQKADHTKPKRSKL